MLPFFPQPISLESKSLRLLYSHTSKSHSTFN
nr:MAG TPA: hypothetical protein [Crassvirales sp.]